MAESRRYITFSTFIANDIVSGDILLMIFTRNQLHLLFNVQLVCNIHFVGVNSLTLSSKANIEYSVYSLLFTYEYYLF